MAESKSIAIRHPNPSLLGDTIDPLLDLDPNRGCLRQAIRFAIVSYPEFSAEALAVDLFPIEAKIAGVVVRAPDRVETFDAIRVAVEPDRQSGSETLDLTTIRQILELESVEPPDSRQTAKMVRAGRRRNARSCR